MTGWRICSSPCPCANARIAIVILVKDTLIILDAGGVLVRNGLSGFFATLAPHTERSFEEIRAFYEDHLREHSQRGISSLEEFWTSIAAFCEIDVSWQQLDADFIASLNRLGLHSVLNRWREEADLWLLSNHRTHWLKPALGPIWPILQRKYISSETGYLKPEPAAFHQLDGQLSGYNHVRFVDDKSRNTEAMQRYMGIGGIIADGDGLWIAQVDKWLTHRA